MEYVRRSTSTRRLVDPKRLVYDLAPLNDGTSHSVICDIIIQQYKLAKDFGDLKWIETVRKECTTILCTKRWVDEHLPSWIYPLSRKRVRPSSAVSSTAIPKMCRDIRLYSWSAFVQEIAAAVSECQPSGVCDAADTANVTVTFLTTYDIDGSASNKRRRFDINDFCIVTCPSSPSSSLQKGPFPGCSRRDRAKSKDMYNEHTCPGFSMTSNLWNHWMMNHCVKSRFVH